MRDVLLPTKAMIGLTMAVEVPAIGVSAKLYVLKVDGKVVIVKLTVAVAMSDGA